MEGKPGNDISSRKDEHIELAERSILKASSIDSRFNYEPLLSPHPVNQKLIHQISRKEH